MNPSNRSRFAVAVVLELATLKFKEQATAAVLAEMMGASVSYLEQILIALRRDNLVEGVRGPGGGYRLALDPKLITVANVIDAIDYHEPTVVERPPQPLERIDVSHMWGEMEAVVRAKLESITIQTLCDAYVTA